MKRFHVDWAVFLTAILMILSFTCTMAYMWFGPRVPWPSISLFYLIDLIAVALYVLARDRGER